MSVTDARDQMVKDWAEKQPRLKRFLASGEIDMLREIYAKKHVCKKVRDILDGQVAELTLYIVTEGKQQKPTSQCKDCGQMAKACKCEGGGDLVEVCGRNYTAVDETGKITLNVPPWKARIIGKLKEETDYIVKGTIDSFDPKKDGNPIMSIKADSAEELDVDLTDVLYSLEKAFELHDGKLEQKIWMEHMQGNEGYEGKIRDTLNVQEKDGMLIKFDKEPVKNEETEKKEDENKEDDKKEKPNYGKDLGDDGE